VRGATVHVENAGPKTSKPTMTKSAAIVAVGETFKTLGEITSHGLVDARP